MWVASVNTHKFTHEVINTRLSLSLLPRQSMTHPVSTSVVLVATRISHPPPLQLSPRLYLFWSFMPFALDFPPCLVSWFVPPLSVDLVTQGTSVTREIVHTIYLTAQTVSPSCISSHHLEASWGHPLQVKLFLHNLFRTVYFTNSYYLSPQIKARKLQLQRVNRYFYFHFTCSRHS